MSKYLKIFEQKKMALIVSLPKNSYELAEAAWKNGADAIKVHINIDHTASKSTFGSLEENREVFERIIKNSPVPLGIVIGPSADISEMVYEQVIEMGFTFISLYGHAVPVSLMNNEKIGLMFAINDSYDLEEVKYLVKIKAIKSLEMSVLKPEFYGTRLTLRSLAKYHNFSHSINIPTILPTQYKIIPSDVKYLHWAKIKALMIGAIVTGNTVETLGSTTKQFKDEINNL